MASIQIPNLPAVIGLDGAELFEGVQAGTSVKISLSQIIAATRAGLPTTLPIPVSLGGTGLDTFTIGDIMYASATQTFSKLADVATGNAIISGGVGAAPSYGKIGLTTHVSGVLPVVNGGTGVTTSTGTGSVVLSVSPDFTGQVSFADGTAAAPSITNTGDLNAGLFFPAADNVAVSTAGTERMRITSAGDIGLGTNAPTKKLELAGDAKFVTTSGIGLQLHNNSSNQSYLQFTNTVTGETSASSFQVGIDADEEGMIWFYRSEPIKFATNSLERMRIDSSGNVGIGTASPTTLLSVDGGTYNQTNYAASALIGLQYASGTKAAPTAVSVSSALGILNAAGNDGAGAYRTTGLIAFYSDGAISPTSAPGFILLSTTPTGTVTPVERLRLGSAGQFGIGGANYGTSGQTIVSAGSAAAPAWGALGAAGGGTGITSYTIGDIVYASGTTTLSKLADVATGNALISGGVGAAPSYGKIGLTTHVSGTLPLANGGTGATTAPAAAAALLGYTATATAGATTTLTNTSSQYQLFTGTLTQTITLPVTSTLGAGWSFHIVNNSTGSLTVNSSGGNLVTTIISGLTAMVTCIGTALTTAADWEAGFTDFQSVTGTGAVALATAPTITTLTANGDTAFGGALKETIYALSGTTPALDPSNGTIQTWTLSASSSPTDSFLAGESMTVMIDDGTAYTITWPSVTWVNNAGVAPTLRTTGYTVIALWKVSTTLYGALVGNGS